MSAVRGPDGPRGADGVVIDVDFLSLPEFVALQASAARWAEQRRRVWWRRLWRKVRS